ncbi:MAG: FkbM family methyltransferase [Alphaproteobacteria bacterium]
MSSADQTAMPSLPGFNKLVKGRYGYFLYNENDIYVGRALRDYGEYSESEMAFLRQVLRPGDGVVEVGANVGAHTVPLAQHVGSAGRVVAVEAQRVVFQTLCANVALNSLVNVDAVHAAAGAAAGTLLIPDIDYSREGNFGGVSVDKFEQGRKVRVAALDEIVDLKRVKLVKIDVEGMEFEVLAGARKLIETHKPFLYLENDRVEKSSALLRQLFEFGYRLWWHTPLLFNPANFFANAADRYTGVRSINVFGAHRSVDLRHSGGQEITDPEAHPLKRARPSR